ncbi:MAG: ABC transporter permease [Bacteroidota bacterium]|nr:ABC transporter permease [Bacteroidota bacterium]
MHKLIASVRKEFLLLLHDLPGVIILFLMPLILLVVITYAQYSAIQASKESKSKILFVNLSKSELSGSIRKSLKENHLFTLTDSLKKAPVTENSSLDLVSRGKYPVAIVIFPGDSLIRVILDPALPKVYMQSLVSSLNYFIKNAQSSITLRQMISVMTGPASEFIENSIEKSLKSRAPIRESYEVTGTSEIKPSAVQNNVPGFILFAMFFIVIPLSGSMVTEKNSGSYVRIRTLPVDYSTFLSGKVIVYLLICIVQCILMLMAGVWLLESIFHLPSFQPGNHYILLAVITIASSLAAIGFGLIVGSLATTHGQAALFGSILIITLGVLSGTFFPIYLFPKGLQVISHLSPICWGIDSYLNAFLTDVNFSTLFINIVLLLLFFIFAMIFSIFIFVKKN